MVPYGDGEKYKASLTPDEQFAMDRDLKFGMAAWHILDRATLETNGHTKRHVHVLGPGIRKALARRR